MNYFDILLAKKLRGGGGGDITIKSLNVTQNGTYSEEGVAYSPVIVNVPLPENAYLLKEIEDVDIATFTDGSDLSMPKLEVAIEPQQEGSGDPSPENIRPIIGWDEANVGVSGKNLFNSTDGEYGKWYSASGSKDDNNIGYVGNYVDISFSDNFYFKLYGDLSKLYSFAFVYFDANKNFLSRELYTISSLNEHSLVIPNNAYYVRVQLSANNLAITKEIVDNSKPQLELGSTATSYEPYNGHTYTIDLDGTRYGGKIDLVSGVMTLTHEIVDLGTLTWGKSSLEATIIYTSIQAKKSGVSPILCSSYKYESDKGFGLNFGAISDSSNQIYINYVFVRNQDFSGKTDLECKTAMNGVQAVYELATPLTIQLTPTVVKSLRGKNNVFADSGNILDLSYLAKEE